MPNVKIKNSIVFLSCVIGVIAVSFVAVRIWVVNTDTSLQQTEHYSMGETIDLSGTFLSSKETENPDGLFITIKSAHLMSYNEFIQAYGTDKQRTKEGLDQKSVIDLEVEIHNEKEAFLPLMPLLLIPERKNTQYIWHSDLWAENEPNSKDALFLAIESGTTYTTHIPYARNGNPESDEVFFDPIYDTKFELTLANLPTHKVVDVVVSD